MSPTFTTTHRVTFSETDMAGIVHFSNYFRMMEEVEHAFFRSLDLSVAMDHAGLTIGWPRVSTSCEYAHALRFEDEVSLVLSIVKVGQKSLTYQVEFLLGAKRVALGKLTSVCCALREGKFVSIAIPADIRHKLQHAAPTHG